MEKRVIREKKGYIRKAVSKLLKFWLDQRGQERIAADALAIIDSGYHLGEKRYKTREDLYDRTCSSCCNDIAAWDHDPLFRG